MNSVAHVINRKYLLALGAVAAVAIGAVAFSALQAGASTGPAITTTVTNPSNVIVLSAPVGTNLVVGAAVASTSSSTVPTGTVTFSTYSNQFCTGSPVVQSGVSLVNGMASSSASAMTATGLSYIINYNGDASNLPSVTGCVAIAPTSGAVSLSTGLSANNVLVGSSVTANATLAGVTAAATGTVSYTYYTNNTCSAATTSPASVTVTNGVVPTSAATTFNVPGTYYLKSVYSGDQSNSGTTTSCGSSVLTVNAVAPTTGTITVDEVTSPSASSTNFQFTTTGTSYNAFSLTDTAAPNVQTLTPGTYTIAQTAVAGWNLTAVSCSRNGATAVAYTPGAAITLAAGDNISCTFTDTAVNTTPVPPTPTGTGSISGTVFNDVNRNKVLDAGEAGISGITIQLASTKKNKWWFMPTAKVMTTAVTDGNGNYSFTNLAAGTYKVEEILPKGSTWKQDSSDFKGITVASNSFTGINFADHAASSTVSNSHHDNDGDDDWNEHHKVASSTVKVKANIHAELKGDNGKHKGNDH